ncbi:MAG: type I methionyl aminopeptidase [Rhodothermales bacterium]
MIHLKSPRDVDGLRKSADLVGLAHTEVARRVSPGVTTMELERIAEEVIRDHGARPAFKGYTIPGVDPFPATLCISVNDVVVHGMPSDYVLEEGDIVSVDCGVELEGYFGDFAYTYGVGEISEKREALLTATKQSLYEGIRYGIEGNRIGDIGHAVQSYCESRGYGVVRALVGHGVGRSLHEDPQVPNFGRRGTGKKLRAGMTICIEPMITGGTEQVEVDADGWTVRTADGEPAAHYEHMVLVNRGEPTVLSSFESIEAVLAEAGMFVPGGEATVTSQ